MTSQDHCTETTCNISGKNIPETQCLYSEKMRCLWGKDKRSVERGHSMRGERARYGLVGWDCGKPGS